MGFFDFFKRKNTAPEPSQITVSLSEDSILINGVPVDIPSHIDTLTRLLGKPRAVVCPKDNTKKTPALKDKMFEPELTTRRVNYAWDKLGLYCYTKNGSVIHCLGIRMNAGDICPKHFPTEFFKGEVTINGGPWLEALDKAKNLDFFKKLMLGQYSAVCEFVDFEADDSARTEKDYTGIEIQLG